MAAYLGIGNVMAAGTGKPKVHHQGIQLIGAGLKDSEAKNQQNTKQRKTKAMTSWSTHGIHERKSDRRYLLFLFGLLAQERPQIQFGRELHKVVNFPAVLPKQKALQVKDQHSRRVSNG